MENVRRDLKGMFAIEFLTRDFLSGLLETLMVVEVNFGRHSR
jgi:hypothetical protein